jgi:hypothetical protein
MTLIDSSAPWRADAAGALGDRRRRVATPGQAARFIARCLSYENAASDRAKLQDLLRGGRVDWLLVARLANSFHLTPALDMGLASKALIDLLPADLRAYLAMIRDLNRQRNQQIARQSVEAFTALNAHGLRPVLMKGGISLFEADLDEGLFMMADMDALLPKEMFPLAHQALRSLGYVVLGESPAHGHALTFGRAGELATIDLHWRVGPQLRLLSAEDARQSATVLKAGRLDIAALCPTHRVLLLLMNYCLFEPHYRNYELPLKGLHDLAVVCRRHRKSIDWREIGEIVRRHPLESAACAWFDMASRLFRVPVPASLRGDGRHMRRCLLQLDHPYIAKPIRFATRLPWVFSPLRMDYRYGCGLTGRSLLAARLHHAIAILGRRRPAAIPALHGLP